MNEYGDGSPPSADGLGDEQRSGAFESHPCGFPAGDRNDITFTGEPVRCWRCGKVIAAAQGTCSFCGAPLRQQASTLRAADASRRAPALLKLIGLFTVLLVVSIVYGWLVRFGLDPEPVHDRVAWRHFVIRLLAVESIDTILVLAGLLWIGWLPSQAKPSFKARLGAWLIAFPVLAILLGTNFGYHWLLHTVLSLPVVHRDMAAGRDLIGWFVLASCVQPAVIEELFCRYLALGILRAATSVHAAVLISSVMFGMAHIFAPFSIPIFIGIGMALGYLRVYSGSLLLPILIHFGHNFAITLGEFCL